MARRRRHRNPRVDLGTILVVGAAAAGGYYLYSKAKKTGVPAYNPVSPSGLRPGDPGYTNNVPAGF